MRLLLLLLPLLLYSQSFKIEKMESNLGIVWGMTYISEYQILLAHKDGRMSILNIVNQKLTSINNPPKVLNKGQGGLLDVKMHSNGWIYLTYVKRVGKFSETTLARTKIVNNKLVNFKDLLVTNSKSKTSYHFGSRIAFDGKGHVFFSIGDRGVRSNGQDISNQAGAILRLNLNGTIPKDNPFINDSKANDAIYSYGHRNAQGLAYDTKNNTLYAIEHGPRGGDELNIIKKGANYGWAEVSKGKEYRSSSYVGQYRKKKGVQEAIKVYTPSIAPSSLLFYTKKRFKSWQGNLFAGALKLKHLNHIELSSNKKQIKEKRLLKNLDERIRNVIQSPQGELLISTDSGNLYRIF